MLYRYSFNTEIFPRIRDVNNREAPNYPDYSRKSNNFPNMSSSKQINKSGNSKRHLDFTENKNEQFQERVEYHSNIHNPPPPRYGHQVSKGMHKTRSSKMLLPSQMDLNGNPNTSKSLEITAESI